MVSSVKRPTCIVLTSGFDLKSSCGRGLHPTTIKCVLNVTLKKLGNIS